MQIDTNSILRTILTFEDTYSRDHFLILEELLEDRLYMITEYPDYLVEEYKNLLQSLRDNPGNLTDIQLRQSFSEKMS